MTSLRNKSSSNADKILFFSFLTIMVGLPLPIASNHLWAWSLFEVFVFLLASIWLLLFAAQRVRVPEAFKRAWPVLGVFTLLFALTLFQLAPLPAAILAWLSPAAAEIYGHTQTSSSLSLDPAATRVAALKTLAYGVLFALTLLLVNQRERLRTLAIVLVFSGVFQAAFGALMTLSGLEYGFFVDKLHNIGVVTGTFVNPNHLAGYLEMCIALGVGLMLANMSSSSTGHWRDSARRLLSTVLGEKARVRIGLIIMVISLVLTKSRMGNIAFLSSLLLAGGFYLLVAKRLSFGIIVFFLSVLLVDVLIIGNVFGLERVASEIKQTTATTEFARIDVSRDTLNMVRDFPLTGAGAGSFASVYPLYDSGKVGFYFYNHAHNDYVQFAAEFGLPGFLLLAAAVIASLWQAAYAQIRRRDRLMRGLACGVFMAVVSLLLHSAVDFNLQIPANAATFVVILAMGWITRWQSRRTNARRQFSTEISTVNKADIVSLNGEFSVKKIGKK